MAQAASYQSPDILDKPNDETMSTSEEPSDEKKSMFGKLKEKTKHKTSKLKHKLKPGSGVGDTPADGTSSSSSSEDEADDSSNNAFSGMTQPEYERKLNAGQLSPSTDESSRAASHNVTSRPAPTIEEFNKKTTSEFEPSHGRVAEHSDLSKQFEGLSTDDKSSSHKDAPDSSVLSDDKFAERTETQSVQKDDILSKAGDPKADDSDVAKGRPDPEGLLSGVKSAEAPKSWGQWVGEKVGLSKPSTTPTTTAVPTSSSAASDKPMTDKVQEALTGAKDTVLGKTSEVTDSTRSLLDQNKEAAATTDPQKQTYTQKFTGAIYGAKESLLSSTHPGDEDKALSQKVTETVSNLPTTIKSTLGFGGNKSTTGAPTSPTADITATTPSVDTPPTPTEESSSALPQSPGIVSRITGSVSSLFGKKQHSDAIPTSAEGAAASETTTTPMETDARAN